MAKQPKPPESMSKAQLVAALKKAYKRIAKLEAPAYDASLPDTSTRFPWQQVLNDTKGL